MCVCVYMYIHKYDEYIFTSTINIYARELTRNVKGAEAVGIMIWGG